MADSEKFEDLRFLLVETKKIFEIIERE